MGQPLDVDVVIERIMTDMGICYQFNSNGSYTMSDAGLAFALILQLNVDPEEYYIGHFASSTGVSLTLYDHYDTVRVGTDALTGVRPNTNVDLAISKSKIKRQAPPADNGLADCFDSENLPNPLKHYQTYSHNGCVHEGVATCYGVLCGCRDIFDPPIDGIPLCNVSQQVNCMLNLEWADYLKCINVTDPCPSPCAQTQYKTQAATYDFPNYAYLEQLYGFTKSFTDAYMSDKTGMQIFFASNSYDYLEEYIPYTWTDVIANLGGTLGICMGASLLTFVEFVQFGFGACVNAWSRRRVRKTVTHVTHVHPAS